MGGNKSSGGGREGLEGGGGGLDGGFPPPTMDNPKYRGVNKRMKSTDATSSKANN